MSDLSPYAIRQLLAHEQPVADLGGPRAELASAQELVREYTRVQPAPFVPRFRLHLAELMVPLWQATERRVGWPQPPPYWAFAWPGSQALAHYLLQSPSLVHGKRVLDFGAGGGLASIAAAHCGAAHVVASDLDPLAGVVQAMNARLNGVAFESVVTDLLDTEPTAHDIQVCLVGDVCFERETAERLTPWLRRLVQAGVLVLLADPGRQYPPADGFDVLATYDVPTLDELESAASKRTRLLRLHAPTAV
jgi:predicted nicotinamide N-methyase